MSPDYTKQDSCRLCGGALKKISDFGTPALTSVFEADAVRIPMTLHKCEQCDLVQLGENTNPQLMYREGYGYKSGINESMVRHLERIVHLGKTYLPKKVLDIGCNDGTLLKFWGDITKHGYDPIGEDVPGAVIVRDYFRENGEKYDVITSIAVLYDLRDPVEFARQIERSLSKNGVWILEVGYAGAILEGKWDAICHEHLTYFGLRQIELIAEKSGLCVQHAELTPTNGGSLLCILGRGGAKQFDISEKEKGWDWSTFDAEVSMSAKNIRNSIGKRKVYVLGASTKGNTLLQHCGLSYPTIEAAIDRNPDKHGKFTPGSKIPIRSEEWARENPPDAFLVLPYHFKEGLLEREKALRERGVKFIFPLSSVEIL